MEILLLEVMKNFLIIILIMKFVKKIIGVKENLMFVLTQIIIHENLQDRFQSSDCG